MTVYIVCHKQYIQTVALLNDFACVLPDVYYSGNIGHIQCICICLYEYSYAASVLLQMKIVSHTEYINTRFLHCDIFYAHSNVLSVQTVCHTQYTHAVFACHFVDAQRHYYYQLLSVSQTLEIYQQHQL